MRNASLRPVEIRQLWFRSGLANPAGSYAEWSGSRFTLSKPAGASEEGGPHVALVDTLQSNDSRRQSSPNLKISLNVRYVER